jgi:hypothetical protein
MYTKYHTSQNSWTITIILSVIMPVTLTQYSDATTRNKDLCDIADPFSNHQNHTISRDFHVVIIQILYDFDESEKSANYVSPHVIFLW